MLFDPVDHHISDLPFVNELAGTRCRILIHRAFKATEEQEDNDIIPTEQVVLLHLHATSGRQVLLEMAVSIVTEGSERHAVLTGREVDSELATLMAHEGTAVSGASSSVSWGSDRCYKSGMKTRPPTRSPSPDLIEASDSAEMNSSTPGLVGTSDSSETNPTRSPSPGLVEASDLAETNRSDSGSSDTTSMGTAVMRTVEDFQGHGTDAAAEIASAITNLLTSSTYADDCNGEAGCKRAGENMVDTKYANDADIQG